MPRAAPQRTNGSAYVAGLTTHVDHEVPIGVCHLCVRIGCVAIGCHQAGTFGHPPRLAAGETHDFVAALYGLSGYLTAEPCSSAKDQSSSHRAIFIG